MVTVVQQVHSDVPVSTLSKDLAVVTCKAMSLEFQLLLWYDHQLNPVCIGAILNDSDP